MSVTASKSFSKNIQYLRGVAVIVVLLYHFWPDYFPMGFLGVDVFFLISGYLMTKSLSKDGFGIKDAMQFINLK